MFKRRVVRFSLACLPLVVFSGLGLVCQPKTLPTTAVQNVNSYSNQQLENQEIVEEDELPVNETLVITNTTIDPDRDEDGELDEDSEEVVVDVEAQNRDAERVARITKIRDALEAYKKTNAAYPEALEVLVTSAYLSSIPKDIDETDFSYTPIGALPAQYYDLCYTLEVGVGAISSGYHCANPDGVANH